MSWRSSRFRGAGVEIAALTFDFAFSVPQFEGPVGAVEDVGVNVFGQPGPGADAVHFQPELAPLFLCGANHLRLRAGAGPDSAAVVDTAAAEPEVEAQPQTRRC